MRRKRRGRVGAIVAAVAALTWGAAGAAAAATVPGGTEAAGAAEASPAHPAPTDTSRFVLRDVFELEWAADPRISPDGERVVYVRTGFDRQEDAERSTLWVVGADGSGHRALTSGEKRVSSPRWSPSGDRLLYLASGDEGTEIWVRWMDTGESTRLTHLGESPSGISWGPEGERIAFTTFVPGEPAPFAEMPAPPEGADWGEPFEVVDRVQWRADGAGRLPRGHSQVFVLPAEGGTPRQLTDAPHDHGGTPRWTPDGDHLILSANRQEDAALDPLDTELYEISVEDGSVRALTDRDGPDGSPAVSPDGSRIAYTGFDDRKQGYQVTKLYVMGRDGSGSRVVTPELDRDVGDPVWGPDGEGLYVQYTDEGTTKVAFVTLDGEVTDVATDVGGLSIGRPYAAGQYSVDPGSGRVAFTHTRPDHPADVAVAERDGGEARRLTRLNRDLFGHKELAAVERVTFESSHDGRTVEGWIAKPPGFDPSEEYPLILEIHGGPFANYGPRFSSEVQLYASAGYAVLYVNPRGSTSYGQAFGNAIHHDYPGHDYDDLMSGVDAAVDRGWVDTDRLYVTGGSGGGVLTSWIVGKTDRFRAAVSAKPVINWYSWALTADMYVFGIEYWFPGPPWEHPEHYMERSPLSLVGQVETPTMLMTGERDFRTPMPETEQYYHALKYRGVETAMVRIPDASHGIASKPSNLMGKVAHVLEWFERHGGLSY